MPCSILRPAFGVLLVPLFTTLAFTAPGPAGTTPESLVPPPSSPVVPSTPGPLILEEPLQPLVPEQTPDQEHQDRLEALAKFSAGCMLQQREKYQEALRLYQRAFRDDPKAVAVVRAIVPLAYQLDRHAEAVRYAMKLVELDSADPLLLNQLGTYLTELDDWQGAVELYERALAARPPNRQNATYVVLRMQMGRLYQLLEQHAKAAECFAEVLDALDKPQRYRLDDPMTKVILGDAGPTYNLMGEAFLATKRFDEAAAAFRKADAIQPNQPLLSYRLARIDLARGKPQPALEQLQPYLDGHLADEGIQPYQLLSDALKALQRSPELLPKLESLHVADPNNVPLGYFLAEQLQEAGQLEGAEKLYGSLMERAPAALGYRNLAEIYRTTGRAEQLLEVLGHLVDKTSTLDILGDEAEKITSDAATMQGLAQAARKQLEASPDASSSGRILAVALLAHDAKQYDVSAEFFGRAIKGQPDRAVQLLLTWGLGLLIDQQYAAAVPVFRRGIEGNATDDQKAICGFYLASALAMAGDSAAALDAARQAAQLKPEVARFHGRVAWVHYRAEQWEEAAKAYRELLERFGSQYSSPETRQAVREARLVLSNIAVLRGQMSEAEERLEEVLDEFPDDVAAMNDLGYLWADQNRNLPRALRMIEAAVQAEPDNAAYRDSLGWVLFRLGRLEEAVTELEKAAQSEADPAIRDHLGDAYHARGHPEKAVQAWQEAAEGFQQRKQNDTLEKVQQKIRSNQK